MIGRKSRRTFVSLTFDDGWADSYINVRSILASHRVTATFYVNSNRVGTSGFMSWAQLEALQTEGHEIGGHTLDHVDLTEQTLDEVRRQVADDRAALLSRGFAVRSFAYPYGEHDERARSIVRDCGYASGRAAWGLRRVDVASRDSRPVAGSIQPKDPFCIATLGCIHSTTPLARLQQGVLRAERGAAHGWVPLVLHRVCDDGGDHPAPSISTATLDALLSWLQARRANGTVVQTVSEVLGETVRPGTRASRTRLFRTPSLLPREG